MGIYIRRSWFWCRKKHQNVSSVRKDVQFRTVSPDLTVSRHTCPTSHFVLLPLLEIDVLIHSSWLSLSKLSRHFQTYYDYLLNCGWMEDDKRLKRCGCHTHIVLRLRLGFISCPWIGLIKYSLNVLTSLSPNTGNLTINIYYYHGDRSHLATAFMSIKIGSIDNNDNASFCLCRQVWLV